MRRIIIISLIVASLTLCLVACSNANIQQQVLNDVATPTPVPLPTESPAPLNNYDNSLILSELMPHNNATLMVSGSFCDWVEVYNCSDISVDLKGWSFSDAKNTCTVTESHSIPAQCFDVIYLTKDEIIAADDSIFLPMALSEGETLSILDPNGKLQASIDIPSVCPDRSLTVDGARSVECAYPSPGYTNDAAGYAAYQNTRVTSGDIEINEVMVANYCGVGGNALNGADWVKIKNISEHDVNLSAYSLSDTSGNYLSWQFPDITLAPGETYIVSLDNGTGDCASFALDAEYDRLYLSEYETVIDYAPLYDIPLNGTYGRMNGENGFFYFASANYKADNTNGKRQISAVPMSDLESGVYNDVVSLTITLSANGPIYYTVDGSRPTVESICYTEPITLTETAVLRAVSVESDAVCSPVLSLSYIINEGHTLPVACVMTDNPADYAKIYNNQTTMHETPGVLELYEEDGAFSIPCGISLAGFSTVGIAKKGLMFHFRGGYGASVLKYDVFDTDIREFSSLKIRAGQDYSRAIIRQEFWQDLCTQMDAKVFNQYGKMCVLYVNGEYMGIFAIKEDYSEEYYEAHIGCKTSTYERQKFPSARGDSFYDDVYLYCAYNDLSVPECYEALCERIDVDSFVDWFIIEGYSANTDLTHNVNFFRSAETNWKWECAFFDLDVAMWETYPIFNNVVIPSPNGSAQINTIFGQLIRNDDFKQRVIDRYCALRDNVLSNENLIATLDKYTDLIRSEVPRDSARWGLYRDWEQVISDLRSLITATNWQACAESNLSRLLKLDTGLSSLG